MFFDRNECLIYVTEQANLDKYAIYADIGFYIREIIIPAIWLYFISENERVAIQDKLISSVLAADFASGEISNAQCS